MVLGPLTFFTLPVAVVVAGVLLVLVRQTPGAPGARSTRVGLGFSALVLGTLAVSYPFWWSGALTVASAATPMLAVVLWAAGIVALVLTTRLGIAPAAYRPVVRTTHPPGWFPDPLREASWRWWDGTSWTDHTA